MEQQAEEAVRAVEVEVGQVEQTREEEGLMDA